MEVGVYPAAVTPFDEKGAIDMPAMARLLAWFASNGCKGAVLAGTNGEGPSLSATEKRDLIKHAVPLGEKLGLEIILGIATPSLDEAVWLCRQAHQAGSPAVLLMAPGYFREAGEEGIEAWFRHVLDRSPVDVLIYNFPKRTGITISPELMSRLAEHDRMLGLKDSSGSRENLSGYAISKLRYVGDETLLAEALAQGWTGTISGAANVVPMWLSQIVAEWPVDRESAEAKFQLTLPAIQAVRSLPQPAGNKRALVDLGVLESAAVRLPLLPMEKLPVDAREVFRSLVK